MKRQLDKIQFEYRDEVQSVLQALTECLKLNPNNKDLKKLYTLLDKMEMEW